MDFRYLAQSRQLDDNQLTQIAASLHLFYSHKQSILNAGARVGKGNKCLDHFQIPKLELMHTVVPSIAACGVVIQWSADATEHVHITEIKVPGRSGNNQSYNPQICRWLDCSEKHRNFALALSIHELQHHKNPNNNDIDNGGDGGSDNGGGDNSGSGSSDNNSGGGGDSDDGDDADEEGRCEILHRDSSREDFFSRAASLSANIKPTTPLPLRTLCTDTTAFQLNFYPSIPNITVDEAATKFRLPDLRPALADYIHRSRDLQLSTFKIGQRQLSPPPGFALPFTHLCVWYSVQMQMCSSDADGPTDSQRISAMPAMDNWPFGRYDTVLLSDGTLPGPGLGGNVTYPQTVLDANTFQRLQSCTDPTNISPHLGSQCLSHVCRML